jgi:hypothetical protein
VSGSFAESQHVSAKGEALYSQSEEGYSTLEYYTDGTVKAHFYAFGQGNQPAQETYAGPLFRSACAEASAGAAPVNPFINECPGAAKPVAEGKPDAPFEATTTVVPGPEYKPTGSRNFFIGKVYRSSWLQPVAVPTLDLRTEKGGLRPYGKGGGRQTTSLKLIAADSAEYVFRSVDKDVTKILPPELRSSFAADLLRDIPPRPTPTPTCPSATCSTRRTSCTPAPACSGCPTTSSSAPTARSTPACSAPSKTAPKTLSPTCPALAALMK